ncbi:MAG: phosphomannomutase/phosphoglucomutase [Propionibacteriaceae bacterium]|jgi:phosphomannomutase|nr:phosphomannomutase/phosphoglucomutase [Propionibacteriaceae bacterium]
MLDAQIFKPGDIRGVVGGAGAQFDAAGAYQLGVAFAQVFELDGGEYVLGHDMRHLGAELALAFAAGAASQGAHGILGGLTSTDELWFASGTTGLPGVMLTASHNPPQYNGAKFCHPYAQPISAATLRQIKEIALRQPEPGDIEPPPLEHHDFLPEFVAKLRSLVDVAAIPSSLKVVVDAGNGMGGLVAPAVLGSLVRLSGLYLELDGSFPNHMPNPLIPENLIDITQAVRAQHADVGLAFDGDADRCFIIDAEGELVDPAAITALIALESLRREPGASIVVNTITSRAVLEAVEAAGGQPIISPIGHSFMKAKMAEHQAIFGGEHSGHFYFREFWGADSGILAALNVLALMGGTGKSLRALVESLPHYAHSGEINSTVADPQAVMDAVAAALLQSELAALPPSVSTSDGLYLATPDWWVSVRMSNTEPLLRLNVEAKDDATMTALRDQTLAIIRKEAV